VGPWAVVVDRRAGAVAGAFVGGAWVVRRAGVAAAAAGSWVAGAVVAVVAVVDAWRALVDEGSVDWRPASR
jgi:hypothetical protein